MLSFQYLKSRTLHHLGYLRNRGLIQKTKLSHYPSKLHSWCGINDIELSPAFINKLDSLKKKYTGLKGELNKITYINDRCITYDDHVSRIVVSGKKLHTATFTRPSLTKNNYQKLALATLPPLANKRHSELSKEPAITTPPLPFTYQAMEENTYHPVCVGAPESLPNGSILNSDGKITENVLHLPIKITKQKAKQLQQEGRVLANSQTPISFDQLYLPPELSSLAPWLTHACQIEKAFNPNFIEDYYIFLSVSHSVIPQGEIQRRGGWHIDGHQGHERVQKSGSKMPHDRQYLICNQLPTQYITHQFNFKKIRDYCQKHFIDLDSVNMQDVIEQQAAMHENSQTVKTITPNQLNFLNPYMVHRVAPNNTDQPIERTFVRILCSTFERNRFGDSINPVIGPIYPLKIKTIRDIVEVPTESYLDK